MAVIGVALIGSHSRQRPGCIILGGTVDDQHSGPLLAVKKQDIGQRRFLGGIHKVGRARALLAHPHVERAVLHEGKPPLGPVKLRDWGLNRQTLGSSSHGAHKQQAIDDILAMYPGLRFALIGDDTQGDLPAFARAVQHNPGRIAAVFLRTVSRHTFSGEEQQARAVIEQAGVPLWLGPDYATGSDFLRAIGVTPGGETERIVRAVSAADA